MNVNQDKRLVEVRCSCGRLLCKADSSLPQEKVEIGCPKCKQKVDPAKVLGMKK